MKILTRKQQNEIYKLLGELQYGIDWLDCDDIREYDQLTKNIRKIATVVGGGYGRIGVMENVNKRYESEKPFNKKE